jgi:hypothetical protein
VSADVNTYEWTMIADVCMSREVVRKILPEINSSQLRAWKCSCGCRSGKTSKGGNWKWDEALNGI